ncbi:hypothetical protein VTL71DRAFT_9918 [Oculimacula yallundae]|uniref:Uncharacterized protein n=1 Tax=Oculimacula yallundae TaxID=86028 RepID=A0ABR4BS95_9HELO
MPQKTTLTSRAAFLQSSELQNCTLRSQHEFSIRSSTFAFVRPPKSSPKAHKTFSTQQPQHLNHNTTITIKNKPNIIMDRQKQLPSPAKMSADITAVDLPLAAHPAPTIADLELRINDLQQKITTLTRSLRAKSKIIREGAVFNTSITTSNLRKEKAVLLGDNKRLREGKDEKDEMIKKQTQKIRELELEVKKLRKEDKKLRDAADNKDRKIEKLKGVVEELKNKE